MRWLIIKLSYLLKLTKLYLLLFLSTPCLSQGPLFEFNEGDIIFQDLDTSPLCEGIEKVTRGYKKLPALNDEDLVDLDTLIADHGLLADREMIWHVAMDKLPEQDRAYIIALLRRGEKFNGEPRITVSTIHGSKGGEADNVVLFTDLSPAAEKAARDNPDDIHRVFYVGVTRTKENLFIVEPEDVSRSYEL